MYRILPRRRRHGRRKGERRVTVLGTQHLLELFECDDVDTLLAKLAAIGMRAYVSRWVASGWGDKRYVSVSDYNLPVEMRARAIEVKEPFEVRNPFSTDPIET